MLDREFAAFQIKLCKLLTALCSNVYLHFSHFTSPVIIYVFSIPLLEMLIHHYLW